MTDTITTAQAIYDAAPLGAIIRYSDGTPKPPARFTRKVQAWERFNGAGQLVRKEPPSRIGSSERSASFTLFKGDLTAGGIVLVKTFETFSVTSSLHFEISRLPQPGAVRVLADGMGGDELVYLATNQAAADAWIAHNGKQNVHTERCEEAATAPRRFTYLQDPGHGWLLLTRQEIAEFGMKPGDFTSYSYVSGDRFALEEDLDMGRFLQTLDQLGVTYELNHEHINQSAYVRNWMPNHLSATTAA